MLVRFNSTRSGEIIMFAEHAHRLFEIIGKEGTARGVFTLEQLPEAIERLHRAVNEEKLALQESERQAHEECLDEAQEKADEEDKKAGRKGISLGQRAHPLIKMMEWTLKEEGFILWEAERDF